MKEIRECRLQELNFENPPPPSYASILKKKKTLGASDTVLISATTHEKLSLERHSLPCVKNQV